MTSNQKLNSQYYHNQFGFGWAVNRVGLLVTGNQSLPLLIRSRLAVREMVKTAGDNAKPHLPWIHQPAYGIVDEPKATEIVTQDNSEGGATNVEGMGQEIQSLKQMLLRVLESNMALPGSGIGKWEDTDEVNDGRMSGGIEMKGRQGEEKNKRYSLGDGVEIARIKGGRGRRDDMDEGTMVIRIGGGANDEKDLVDESVPMAGTDGRDRDEGDLGAEEGDDPETNEYQ